MRNKVVTACPHSDFEDGVRYMRVVQAVADSRARNEWVEIKR
jgi:hypothetical protein